jgi:glycosyltransferase involved in cell wall biosynthesis
MKIALIGPISLQLIADLVNGGDSLPRGYEYPLAAYLVREYVRQGHQVVVVSHTPEVSETCSWYGENVEIHVVRRRRHYLFCLDCYQVERRAMLQALKQASPDIVHAQWTYEFAHVALASGFPYLVTARDSPRQILKHMRSLYRLYRYAYAKWLIPRLATVTAISPYMAEELQAVYHLKQAVRVIPNGLAGDLFQQAAVSVDAPGTVSVVTVSGWDPRKNVKPLLQAFQEVVKQRTDVKLVLIGAGLGENEPGHAWALENDCVTGVEFQGRMSHADMLQFLRTEADVFVHTTKEESFGMAIVEAMAQSLPVVAGESSGAVPWLLGDGTAGILVDCCNAQEIAAAIMRLAADPDLRACLGQAAYERAQSKFRMSGVAGAYLDAYAETIQ